MLREEHIEVSRTARYFTLGSLDANTHRIAFVLHGYAQLAKDFIQQFSELDDSTRFIVAPEGLNRFYAKGFGGKPAATWMTSEDRENEIKDYVQYLDKVYQQVVPKSFNGKIIVIGFSQGVATASRWIHHSQNAFHQFIIHSGEIGLELQKPLSEKLKQLKTTYITGTKDKLIAPEKHQLVYDLMKELEADIIEFEGGHELNLDAIKQSIN